MLSKDDITTETTVIGPQGSAEDQLPHEPNVRPWSRKRYAGTLLFNIGAFILPALYSTLSKLWVANIDSSMVATTDAYTYIGVVVEVLNEGLPRASWNIIGDKSNRTLAQRHGLAYTLIAVQSVLGLLMSIVFVAAAQQRSFIDLCPNLGFFSTPSTIETAVAAATRALDQPDVPLMISSVKFFVNIVLDFIIISKFHIKSITPTVNTQAATQLACNMVASLAGLVYFIIIAIKSRRKSVESGTARITYGGLKILARPGSFTFAESAIRNALYLWLVSGIISMSSDYATAWGVFNTIRWGLVMVPVQALEATSLAFIGHTWGAWRRDVGVYSNRPSATFKQLRWIVRPALVSCLIGLAVEVPICLFLSFYGARRFAFFISESVPVSLITEQMWKTIDWCYIFYAVSTQLATILLATRPRWYLYQSLISNIGWVLPWAIAVTRIGLTQEDAWKYHSIVFGGSLVFSFFDVLIVDILWAWVIRRGRMSLPPVTGARPD